MYKDPDRQREADKARQKRRRDKIKAEGVTKQSVTVALYQHSEDVVKPERSYIGAVSETPDTTSPKRGKDIKHFGDLPMDVQASIDRLSVVDGKIDQTVKANRTAIAVNYQHQFPNRFHSTGVN